jgi:hypothetical protein
MWALAWACASAPPPPKELEAHAWGGGTGARVVLTGDAVGELAVPGADAATLGAFTRAPPRDPCPGDSLRWRRDVLGAREQGDAMLVLCGRPSGASFRGEPLDELALELGDGSVWLDGWTASGRHLRAEAPFDRKVSLAGTHRARVSWDCLDCGPDGGRTRQGEGEFEVTWAFDRDTTRTWRWTKGR